MSAESIPVFLILAAVCILGAVVMPRLGGWIFNPKDTSFLYVWFIGILCMLLWYHKTYKSEGEPWNIYDMGAFGFLFFFGILLVLGKDKSGTNKDEESD